MYISAPTFPNPSSPVRLIVTAALLSLSVSIPLFGQETGSYQVRTFSESEGLPHNTVNTLVQTADRYIWIGTDAGLVRWDGYRFIIYSIWNTPVLKSGRILSLHQDPRGTLWIGTAGGGLYSYRDGAFEHYMQAMYLEKATVRALVSDRAGSLWAGTEFGLYRLDTSGYRRYSVDDGLPDNIITSLALDSSGCVWAGTLRGGAAKFKADRFQLFTTGEGLGNTSVLSLAAERYGGIWIGTMRGLYHVAVGEPSARLQPGISYTPVSAILPSADGSLWIGTMTAGLQLYKNGEFVIPVSIPDNNIPCLCQVGDILYAGTAEQGLAEIDRPDVRTVPAYGNRPAFPVLVDRTGTLWVGTENEGLIGMRHGKVVRRYTSESGLAGNRARALLQDSRGKLWTGDESGGGAWIDTSGVHRLSHLSGTGVYGFWQNGQSDTVWIAAADGLYFHDGKAVGKIAELTGRAVQTLAGNGNALFVGTEDGIYRWSGGIFRKLENPAGEPAYTVNALYADKDGTLWIATDGSGLKRWREGTFVTYSTLDGLPDDVIFSIVPGTGRSLWLGSRRGIALLNRDSLEAAAGDRRSGLHPVWITGRDGLPDDLCSSCNPAAVAMDSLLYVSTRMGVGKINTAALLRHPRKPQCSIVSIAADGRIIPLEQRIILPPGTRHIAISFTAFDYGHAEKVRFRCMLQGADTVYSRFNPGQRRTAEYRDLPPGEYHFAATAMSDRAVVSDTSRLIFILPQASSRNGFPILAAVFIAAFAVLIFTLSRKIRNGKEPAGEKYRTTPVDPERVNAAQEKLRIYMNEDKLYLDPDLSLKTLAKALKIHPNHLSRIINEQFGVSFNDYINRFRIEEAQRKLNDPREKEKSILDIMYECGFYSKSVFNTAFRKFANTTPSKYRKDYS